MSRNNKTNVVEDYERMLEKHSEAFKEIRANIMNKRLSTSIDMRDFKNEAEFIHFMATNQNNGEQGGNI